MTDILQRLRCTIPCQVMDPASGCHCAEAAAEIKRLRAGGCARDQGTTQYCAEAAEKDARMQRMALEYLQDTGQLSDEITRLRVALLEIRDAGPMTVDDQRWRVAKDALENSNG